jgi:hypothetical protein
MEMGESIFVKCDCGCCSVIEVNADAFDNEAMQFNFALWVQHPGTRPMSKKERIRWCDHVMKTGKPWADHTIVTTKDAQRIAEFITKQLTQHGKKKQVR